MTDDEMANDLVKSCGRFKRIRIVVRSNIPYVRRQSFGNKSSPKQLKV